MPEPAPVPFPATAPTAAIPVRSERQAMDWALVLASQDIATAIVPAPERGGWALEVDAASVPRAVAALRQYHRENRRWHAEVPAMGMPLHWGVVLWCALLGAVAGYDAWSGALTAAGRLDSVRAAAGEWWRLFTATFLHGDVAHLFANLTTGFVFLGLAMGRYGAGPALLGSLLCGAAGNAAGLLLHARAYYGVGASGAVMGAVGMLAAASLAEWRQGAARRRLAAAGLLGGAFLFVLLGTDPRSDVPAHAGGLLAGLLLGGAMSSSGWPPGGTARRNALALALFLALAALAWILAFG